MAPPPSVRRVVSISFLVDLVDVATNLAVALVTGSAVVFAEMAQGLADALGSLLLVVGDRRSLRPRDAEHPFGYGREVFFWALLSAVEMLVVGVGLSVWRGLRQMLEPAELEHPGLAVAVLALGVVTNGYALSQSLRRLGAGRGIVAELRDGAQPLVANTLLRDGMGTLAATLGLLALVLYAAGAPVAVDAVGALVVASLMAVSSVVLIAQARGLIAGRAVSADQLERIRAAVAAAPGVVAINRLSAVHAGRGEVVVDLDLDLVERLSTVDVERVIDTVQAAVRAAVPGARMVRLDLNSPDAGAGSSRVTA